MSKKTKTKKPKTKKPKAITINLNNLIPDELWESGGNNFVYEQPERFVLITGKHCRKGGFLYFCERYLEAAFLMAIYGGVAMYSDELKGGYAVVAKKKKEK